MIELEAKIRLSSKEKNIVLKKLKSFANFVWEKNKEDFYFSYVIPALTSVIPAKAGIQEENKNPSTGSGWQNAGSGWQNADSKWQNTNLKWQKSYPLFRIRKENTKNIVTQKKHIIKDWIETNEEIEFEVSDFNSFFNFAKTLWYENSVSKIKKSLFFTFWDFNLELCEVPPLWWFLEIEIITTKEDLEKNKIKLIEVFNKFWFNEKDFERKKYLELLK